MNKAQEFKKPNFKATTRQPYLERDVKLGKLWDIGITIKYKRLYKIKITSHCIPHTTELRERQREPNAKSLRSPLSVGALKLWTLRVEWRNSKSPFAWPRPRAKKWKYKFILIFHFLEWWLNPQPVAFTVTFVSLRLGMPDDQWISMIDVHRKSIIENRSLALKISMF